MKKFSAIILAGGKSTRMGSDKAFLPFRNSTFLEQIVSAVSPLTREIYLSGNNVRLRNFCLPIIEDIQEDCGPVVALASCFPMIKTENVLVLSCDVPLIRTTDLEFLLEAHSEGFDVTFYNSKNRDLPLVGVYSKSSFNAFAEALNTGESRLFSVLKNLKTQSVSFTGKEGLENINTKEDLKSIL